MKKSWWMVVVGGRPNLMFSLTWVELGPDLPGNDLGPGPELDNIIKNEILERYSKSKLSKQSVKRTNRHIVPFYVRGSLRHFLSE